MYKFTLLEKGKAWTQAQQRLILQHLQRQVMRQTPPLTPHSPLSHSHFCVLTEYREMSLCIHNGPQVLFQLQGSQAWCSVLPCFLVLAPPLLLYNKWAPAVFSLCSLHCFPQQAKPQFAWVQGHGCFSSLGLCYSPQVLRFSPRDCFYSQLPQVTPQRHSLAPVLYCPSALPRECQQQRLSIHC